MNLTWGKPRVEYGKIESGAEPKTWHLMPIQKEDTVQLTTNKQSAKELFGEGHELVARKALRSVYVCEMEVFIDAGEVRPIQDNDGVIDGIFALRVTPEDEALTGFQFKACQVEAEELWSSAEGSKIKYTFTAVRPESGKMFEPYKKSAAPVNG